MSDAVLVALITVVVGGFFTAVFKLIDQKANQAKDEVNKNTAEVDAVTKALSGMEILTQNLRADLDRAEHGISFWRERSEKLERDLIEEKAINIAITRENERLKGATT